MKRDIKESIKELIRTLDNCIEAIEAIEESKDEIDNEKLREYTRELDKNFSKGLPMYGKLIEPVNDYIRNKRLILYSKHLSDATGLTLSQLIELGEKERKSWDI